MKKLKLKTLGLGATEILSRAQMKNVWGGVDCKVSNSNASGFEWHLNWPSGSAISCSGMSSWANTVAVSVQLEYGGSTHYDCGCDGWGS